MCFSYIFLNLMQNPLFRRGFLLTREMLADFFIRGGIKGLIIYLPNSEEIIILFYPIEAIYKKTS